MNDPLILSLANFAIINELHSKAGGEGIGQKFFKEWLSVQTMHLKNRSRELCLDSI